MLRITQNSNASAAVKYFDEGLSRADYYEAKGEVTGLWGGHASKLLGLSGAVERGAFHALCHNADPATGARLTARSDVGRTTGYDFTFSVPKSVSLVHSQTGDPDILAALDAAVAFAMSRVECDAQARVRKGGRQENRTTGNLCWASFTHADARPVGGVPDPHLHTHVFVFNATYDREENQWKAGQFRNLKAEAPYYEALFNNRLAYGLRRAGYELERGPHNFELAGFTRETVEKFSNRTLQVERKIRELGLEYAEDKARVGAKTRASKRSGLGREALRAQWAGRLSPEEKRLVREAKKTRPAGDGDEGGAVRGAVDHALLHALERKSVVGHNELMTLALKRSMGAASAGALEAEVAGRDGLLGGEVAAKKVYTHTAALEEERRLVGAARAGRGAFGPLAPDYAPANAGTGGEQERAVRHALGSRDFITVITGGAGTGKTRAVREIADAVQARGTGFFAFAPSASASRGTQRDEGFGDATTVAALLQDTEAQARLRGGVLRLDEAGMVGCGTLNRVIAVAQEQDARLLLTGDTRQHTGVERGDALRILQKFGGIKPAHLGTIRRQQKEEYKEAVAALAQGRTASGFAKLERMGAIKDGGSFDGAVAALAKEYVQARRAREETLVVAPTHGQGRAVTAAIRAALKEDGKLAKTDRMFGVQTNLSLTGAQKADPASYAAGQAVQFHQNARGFARGERCEVLGPDGAGGVLVRQGTKTVVLPMQDTEKFSVYRQERIGLAGGDLIRVTQNGFSAEGKRLSNGNVLTVTGFDGEGNVLAATSGGNPVTLPRGFGNFAHGYYTTSPGAQGKSVNRVLVLQTTHTGRAASSEQFYVSASRGRFEISVHTDDKEALLESVQRSSARMSATELAASAQARERARAALGRGRDGAAHAPAITKPPTQGPAAPSRGR